MIKYFKKWFKVNEHKFNQKIKIEKSTKDQLHLKYENIIPQIKPVVNFGDINIHVEYNDCPWDLLISIDGAFPQRTNSGEYYCEECPEEARIYYKTIYELHSNHTFKFFLEWSNENINFKNYLFLLGKNYSYTDASVGTIEKLDEFKRLDNLAAILKLEKFRY